MQENNKELMMKNLIQEEVDSSFSVNKKKNQLKSSGYTINKSQVHTMQENNKELMMKNLIQEEVDSSFSVNKNRIMKK